MKLDVRGVCPQIVSYQRTNEIPQAANSVVGGVGNRGGATASAVGAELLADGCYRFSLHRNDLSC